LRLICGRTLLHADGEDLAMVEVAVVDAQGRRVPTASNPVAFSVSGVGTLKGVGNGNPTDHESDQAPQRRAFSGRCMVLVGSAEKRGTSELTASSPGLQSAHMKFVVR
jgi:beta-galactosidase